jgi:hypothetical protein
LLHTTCSSIAHATLHAIRGGSTQDDHKADSQSLCQATSVSFAVSYLTNEQIKMIKSKIRWGDTLDDEDALPPTTVKGPDSHGIKITTDYYKNDKGEAIKKVTKVKVVNVEKKVYKVGDWSSRFSHSAMQACLHHAKPHTHVEAMWYLSESVWHEQQ